MPLVLTKNLICQCQPQLLFHMLCFRKNWAPEKPVKGTVSLEIINVIPRMYQLFCSYHYTCNWEFYKQSGTLDKSFISYEIERFIRPFLTNDVKRKNLWYSTLYQLTAVSSLRTSTIASVKDPSMFTATKRKHKR